MTDIELREKVIRHDYEFKALTESLNSLGENMKELTTSLKHIAVINEKLFNMDRELKDSFQRVHNRCDDFEEEMKDLEVARFFSKYPKLLLAVILGLSVINIEPIRKIIFGG